MDEARRKSAAKANTERGKNGIIHAMKPHAKSALSLALAIVGGIAAGMRCDASEWVENSSQTNPRVAAYTVKTYTEGSDPFDVPKHGKGKQIRQGVPLYPKSRQCNSDKFIFVFIPQGLFCCLFNGSQNVA